MWYGYYKGTCQARKRRLRAIMRSRSRFSTQQQIQVPYFFFRSAPITLRLVYLGYVCVNVLKFWCGNVEGTLSVCSALEPVQAPLYGVILSVSFLSFSSTRSVARYRSMFPTDRCLLTAGELRNFQFGAHACNVASEPEMENSRMNP